MTKFIYKAIDSNSKTIKGNVEAQDFSDAVVKLRQLQITPVDIKEDTKQASRFVPRSDQLANFSREISVMLSSGIPIVKALSILMNSKGTDKRLIPLYSELYKQLRKGIPLSEAMKMQGRAFPEMMINMFTSGEMTGDIDIVADRLSKYYDSDYRMKNKINTATIYPKILAGLTVLVVLIMFTFVLPMLFELKLFQSMELPLITRVMIAMSSFFTTRWYIALGLSLVIVLLYLHIKSINSVKIYIDKKLLNTPKIGELLKKIYTARFSMTLSSMYSSGIQLVNAVAIASKTTGNTYIQEKLSQTARELRHGIMLSATIGDSGMFSERLTTSIIVGEETGRLDDILESTSKTFEYEADIAIGQLLSLIEPILIVVMSIIILTVILSVLIPLLGMYSTLRQGG